MKQLNQILITVALLVILGVGGFFATQQLKERGSGKVRQAVFLTNGQVYFGYISKSNAKTVTMRDIYYLQVQQPLQPSNDANSQQQPQISLVKLGNELHGPKDEMKINRDHILFWEDMKDDSKVNEAISEYVKSGGKPAAATTPAASPAP